MSRPQPDRQSVLDVLSDSDGQLADVEKELVAEVRDLSRLADPPGAVLCRLNMLRATVHACRLMLGEARDEADRWR